MPECEEVLGTRIIKYEDVDEFREALESAKPARLHTSLDSGFLGIGGSWRASFVDSEETVHGYITHDVRDNHHVALVQPIYDLILRAEITEVDGAIRVSVREGSVYHLFITDAPSVEERVQTSYDAWIDAVRDLPVEGTFIQYLKVDSNVILDATYGKNHLVTAIDESSDKVDESSNLLQPGRTLEGTLTRLRLTKLQSPSGAEVTDQPYTVIDNAHVINWYLDMKNV